MKRTSVRPRDGWEKIVESQGLTFHTVEGHAYWDESAYYMLDERDASAIETASNALWSMCREAVDFVVQNDLMEVVGIPAPYRAWVAKSWRDKEPSLYGRFDLAYDGSGPARLLEFNADTPTSLVESAVAQWYWFKDVLPNRDQFNTLHEALVQRWKAIKSSGGADVHFACMYEHDEDWMTINYLRDTALQAGVRSTPIAMEDIGWNAERGRFLDEQERPISTIFKLYPWEWMFDEAFAQHLPTAPTPWIEPPWKAILSSKGILAVLWQQFPESPHLLPASLEPMDGDHVVKPVRSREGCNVRIVRDGRVVEETTGPYGDGPVVYQRFAAIRPFDGRIPTVGSWMVGEKMCGVGIREDRSLITRNTSSFVPHVYVP